MDSVPYLFVESVLRLAGGNAENFEDFPDRWSSAANPQCPTFNLHFVVRSGEVLRQRDGVFYLIDSSVPLERLLSTRKTICRGVTVEPLRNMNCRKRDMTGFERITTELLNQLTDLIKRNDSIVYAVRVDLLTIRVSDDGLDLVKKLAESIPAMGSLTFGMPHNSDIVSLLTCTRLMNNLRSITVVGNVCQKYAVYPLLRRIVEWWTAQYVPTKEDVIFIAESSLKELRESYIWTSANYPEDNTPEWCTLLENDIIHHPLNHQATLRIREEIQQLEILEFKLFR